MADAGRRTDKGETPNDSSYDSDKEWTMGAGRKHNKHERMQPGLCGVAGGERHAGGEETPTLTFPSVTVTGRNRVHEGRQSDGERHSIGVGVMNGR